MTDEFLDHPLAAAAPGGGVRALMTCRDCSAPAYLVTTALGQMFRCDACHIDWFQPVNQASDGAQRSAGSAVFSPSERTTSEGPREGSSSSSSTSERLRGLATDLRAFLDDLDCGSYGERHYMDPDDVRHIVKDLRPLADRLDVLAGESAKVDK